MQGGRRWGEREVSGQRRDPRPGCRGLLGVPGVPGVGFWKRYWCRGVTGIGALLA